jgi:TonB family protein
MKKSYLFQLTFAFLIINQLFSQQKSEYPGDFEYFKMQVSSEYKACIKNLNLNPQDTAKLNQLFKITIYVSLNKLIEVRSEMLKLKFDVSDNNQIIAYCFDRGENTNIKYNSKIPIKYVLELLQSRGIYKSQYNIETWNFINGKAVQDVIRMLNVSTNEKFEFNVDCDIKPFEFSTKDLKDNKDYPNSVCTRNDLMHFDSILSNMNMAWIIEPTTQEQILTLFGSQNTIQNENTYNDGPLSFVEQMPEFTGGEDAMFSFIKKNMKYPKFARENQIEGEVHTNFIINKDGSIRNVKITKGIKGGCDEEAIRLIKSMPLWKPGKQGGNSVPVYQNVIIKFIIK